MKLRFFMEHENAKLVQLYLLQALLIISVLVLFFYSIGFVFYFAILAALIGFLSIAVLFHFLNLPFYILPKISGAVYVPTSEENVQTMVKLAKVKKGMRVIDLGSGDGRVVAAFADAGADAVGVELNPSMVEKAERLLAAQKIKNAKIVWQSLWDVDLGEYDVVTIYAVPSMMKALTKKFRAELRPGTRVISNHYPIPGWTIEAEKNQVFLYII